MSGDHGCQVAPATLELLRIYTRLPPKPLACPPSSPDNVLSISQAALTCLFSGLFTAVFLFLGNCQPQGGGNRLAGAPGYPADLQLLPTSSPDPSGDSSQHRPTSHMQNQTMRT